jgi:hypothetical protein
VTAATCPSLAEGFARLGQRLAADQSIPPPRTGTPYAPVTIYAPDGSSREQLLMWAESLGLEDGACEERAEEDGWPYLEVTGRLDGLHVRIAAGTGARVLEPLASDDPSLIHRTYPAGVAL